MNSSDNLASLKCQKYFGSLSYDSFPQGIKCATWFHACDVTFDQTTAVCFKQALCVHVPMYCMHQPSPRLNEILTYLLY